MTQDDLRNRYFTWLYDLVCEKRFAQQISYKKLLMNLHNVDFRYSIPNDSNRAEDGVSLRYRFALSIGYEDAPELVIDALEGPCSVLEMMVALALHCEENIMDDPSMGNRTGQWFWGMVVNLGLGNMTDDRFDKHQFMNAIDIFLDREYEPDGRGGLFTVRHCDRDLRSMEIWHQLCRYLNNIT